MKVNVIIYTLTLAFAIFGVSQYAKVKQLKKQLMAITTELSEVKDERDNVESKLRSAARELGSSEFEIEQKISNIRSHASSLESSIDRLIREIRRADCEACNNLIWDIQSKARSVESDIESLQSEIDD